MIKSMDRIRLWFIAGAMTVAFAGGYIFWGPSSKPKKRRKDLIPGMKNVGNSCFLNAVLQALASCPVFIAWLQNVITRCEGTQCFSLAMALLSTLKALNRQSPQSHQDELCTPMQVIEALRAKRWVISNDEQDAHELFHVLTTTLEEDFTAAHPVLSLLEVGKLENLDNNKRDTSCGSLQKPFMPFCPESTVKYRSPTRGLLASQLTCKQCGSKFPVRYDNFDSISLVIPTPHWGPVTLQDCLQKYISRELVQDVICDICSSHSHVPSPSKVIMKETETKTTFIKQLSFGKVPECLCIHIQRTVWLSNGMPMKCFDHVAFPEVLQMDDYVYSNCKGNKKDGINYPWARLFGGSCVKENRRGDVLFNNSVLQGQTTSAFLPTIRNSFSDSTFSGTSSKENSSDSGEHMYLLKAVIVHLGDVFSGHFITYRRGSMSCHSQHKWFFASDSTIKEVPFSEVLQSCAYMLFYEKMVSKN